MMAQSSREAREPACSGHQHGSAAEAYTERPAAAYPPGYPRLCRTCFGGHVEQWDGHHAPEFDHREVTDVLVRSRKASGDPKYHLPEGQEVQG